MSGIEEVREYYETHSTEAEIAQAAPNEQRVSSMAGYTIALPLKALNKVRQRAERAGVTTGEMLTAIILTTLGNDN